MNQTPIAALLRTELPIVLAPMAGVAGSALAIAVCEAGGLGSLPCATSSTEQIRAEVGAIRSRTSKPFNLNFFCHAEPREDAAKEAAWRARLARYDAELAVDRLAAPLAAKRRPFDAALCDLVVELAPAVVSFHFGLPEPALVERVKQAGAKVLASATTVGEARWLESRGCDAVIAQGYEAGGHRGMFLGEDVSNQLAMVALVPQVVDAVRVPVIAAGGIADGRGIVAAFALGAAAVQIGTAYLACPESKISAAHRRALSEAAEDATVLTNVLSGRPARGVANRVVRELGPITDAAPAFPRASDALAPIRAKAEATGSTDFSQLLAGQSLGLAFGARGSVPAGELTRALVADARARLAALGTDFPIPKP